DAGIHSLPYPAVGASYSHHVAVIYCHSDGIRSDTDSGYESGAVKFWYRPGAGSTADFHQ
ncbi:divalent metal cation transporter MntH, partial [Escherichia coli]